MATSDVGPLDVARMKEKAPQTLAERVALVEARQAIMNVLGEYSTFADGGDSEGVASLYTEDVEWVLAGTVDYRLQGKDALRKRRETAPGQRGWKRMDGKILRRDPESKLHHIIAAPVIKISDDLQEAWVTAHHTAIMRKFTGFHSLRTGHEGVYVLHFVKEGDAWKIRKFVNITELAYDPMYTPQD